MKKFTVYTYALLALLLSVLANNTAKASHAAGGELIYRWKSDSTYTFYFKFYRDCSGVSEPASVTLCHVNTCTNQSNSIGLTKMTTLPGGIPNGTQVATGCANRKNKCDSFQSNIPGYREWWYTGEITLPSRCNSWKFGVSIASRNTSANIVGGDLYLETTLNNLAVQNNSSPVFSVKPVPYVCLNQPYKYNNGGVDPDGDSVAFEVQQPLNNPFCTSATSYSTFQTTSPPYIIPSNPFQTNNTFTINAITGELSFTPGLLGAHTVTVKAKEYRNGVLLGSVMRDIQVQVINCQGGNVTPVLTIDTPSVSGTATFTGGVIRACANQQFSFCYKVTSSDTAAKLVVTDNSGVAMPGSVVTYSNLQNDSVRACVTWTPSPIDTGNRVFVVTAKDSNCTSSGIIISHSITVPVFITSVTAALKDTAICAGDSTMLIGVGGTAYVWSVVPGGSPISSLSCTNCKTPYAKPSFTTRYIVTSNSSSVCGQNEDTVTVTVIQQSATGSSNSPVCPGGTLQLFCSVGAPKYSWTGPNGFTSTLRNPTIPNAQAVNSGFYYVTVSNDSCSSQPFAIQVLVAPPAGPVASGNSPVCVGSQAILTATTVSGSTVTYHWTGPNSYTSTQQNPIINPSAFTDSGKYVVYAMKDGCKTTSDSINLKINPIPAPPVATIDTITFCEDGIATALTATGTALKWYNVPTGGVGSSTIIPTTTTAGVFKYYVSQTVGGCESLRDSVQVTIKAKPAEPLVSNNTSLCQNAVVGPLTATGNNLQWYTTPTGGSPLGFAPTPSTTTPGNIIYFVSQTDAITGCESDRALVSVTISAQPVAPLALPAYYCEGGPSLPSTGTYVTGTDILWYTTPTGGTGTPVPPVVNTSVAHIDTFYITQTLNSCESPRAMMFATVHPLPAPPATNDTVYCQFDATVPVAATGTNLLWYSTATGGTGSTTAPTPTSNTAGTQTFYVSQTVNGCEGLRDSVVVTINGKPLPPVGNDDSVCQFTTASALTATGTNLLWYTTAIGGIGTTTAPVPRTDTAGAYYWYVSQRVNNCESDRDTVEIIVKPQPAPPTSDTAEFCLNGPSDTLTATGQNLLWYSVPVGGFGATLAPIPSTATIGFTYFYISQTIDGCESKRDTMAVKVDTLVSVHISFSDSSFCLYDTVQVSQSGRIPDTADFKWNWGGGTVISGDTSGPFVIKWDTHGIKTVILNADDNGCRANDTAKVEVLPVPEVYFNMTPEVCMGIDVNMVVDSVLKNAATFVWTFDSVNTTIVGVDSNKYTARWSTPGIKIVSLYTVSDSGCVSKTIYDTITVREDPKVKIETPDNSTVCTKSEIVLKANALTNGLYKYEWSPTEYFLTNKSAEVTARVSSSGYMKLSVTDQFGCVGEDSTYLAIKLCCKVVLPDAFSPNNDGKNDGFGIISNGSYRISAFRVVNRLGQVVFSTNNQRDRWDGTFKGIPQGIGTYYYYIKYNCQDDDADHEVEERGNVILVR